MNRAAMPDRELAKAAALAALRESSSSGTKLVSVLRWCYYQDPGFCSVLFTESALEWFGPECDIRTISKFVANLENCPAADPYFRRGEAEAVIRVALGEVKLAETIHPRHVNYPEIGIAVLTALFGQWRPGPATAYSLFSRTAATLARAREIASWFEPAEEAWFTTRMHESPFAVGLVHDQSGVG
jgi:hypothetical protein